MAAICLRDIQRALLPEVARRLKSNELLHLLALGPTDTLEALGIAQLQYVAGLLHAEAARCVTWQAGRLGLNCTILACMLRVSNALECKVAVNNLIDTIKSALQNGHSHEETWSVIETTLFARSDAFDAGSAILELNAIYRLPPRFFATVYTLECVHAIAVLACSLVPLMVSASEASYRSVQRILEMYMDHTRECPDEVVRDYVANTLLGIMLVKKHWSFLGVLVLIAPSTRTSAQKLRFGFTYHALEETLSYTSAQSFVDFQRLVVANDQYELGLGMSRAMQGFVSAQSQARQIDVIPLACVVCLDGARETVAAACGHLSMCSACTLKWTEACRAGPSHVPVTCPICKTHTAFQRVFL